jgi:hypothetical protein
MPKTSIQFKICFGLHDRRSLTFRAEAAGPAAITPRQVKFTGRVSVTRRSNAGTIEPSHVSMSMTRGFGATVVGVGVEDGVDKDVGGAVGKNELVTAAAFVEAVVIGVVIGAIVARVGVVGGAGSGHLRLPKN